MAVPSIDHKIMAFGLATDRLIDSGIQKVVAFGSAQRPPQVGSVILAQAHVESPGASDPNAVAGFTEVMCQRRNEANTSAGFFYADIAGRSARTIVNVFKRISLSNPSSNERERQIL